MRKAGGIIALIAGLLGLIAAVITLFFGGLGSAFNSNGAKTVIGLGWAGIFICFLIIVLGAIAMNAKSIAPGILIILSSIIGATHAGNLVAVIMVLAFVGGVLACLAPNSETVQPVVKRYEATNGSPDTVVMLGISILIGIYLYNSSNNSNETQESEQTAQAKEMPQNTTITIPNVEELVESGEKNPATPSPSFDCKTAHTKAETIICSDVELAKLDQDLAALFKDAEIATLDKAVFMQTNKEEWKRREKNCSDRDCLLQWYGNRHTQLVAEISSESKPTDQVVNTAKIKTSTWSYNQNIDKMREQVFKTASTSSTNKINLFGFQDIGVSLVVQKDPDGTYQTYLRTEGPALNFSCTLDCSVTVKFDDQPIEKFSAHSANSLKVLILSPSDTFLEKLQKAQKVIIETEFITNDSNTKQLEFNTNEFLLDKLA